MQAVLFENNRGPTPVLRGRPLVGSLLDFRRDRLAIQEKLASLGDVVRFRMGPYMVTALNSPEAAHELFTERAGDTVKSLGLARFGRPVLGEGLLVSEGAVHKRQRKLLAPAFQHKRIAGYAAVMAERCERAAERWGDGEELDVAEAMNRLTLDIVGRTLFDADVEGDARAIGSALTDAMRYMVNGVTSPWGFLIPYAWPTPANERMRRAVRALDEVVYRLIAERRAKGGDRGDVLSMLLLARDEDDGHGMTDTQVRDEAMTLLLAGHETTANALAWAWHLLAQNPGALGRMADEVRGVCQGRPVRPEDLTLLPYTLQVFKETLRLRPPAYIVTREAVRDFTITGHPVAAGGVVMVGVHALHRRPDTFPDPLAFRPERFAPEAEKKLPRGAFLPFGGGPRVCIGNHFATMEGQLVLATLVQRVRFTPRYTSEPVAEPMVTLRPKGGLPMRVTRV
ncbi:MAG: cytochrome P450 [Deltaproteobacteria bacterium]|nr:cytochrome P450 [Deltaproteobacteria bacterium]